ncbi:MAG: beta-eliminating lyase-related protein [Ruminococcus bromii]|nr:beta-eliminating lyase-related protein [Ruminococcus bromii]
MIYFNCDYTEGCHPKILERLCETNLMQTIGYGEDEICDAARAKIRAACCRDDIDVHFLVGGTQANATVIASILRPHQGALSAETGHINVHETGAVEATGHKVLALPATPDGKISAAQVEAAYTAHVNDASFEHMVQPKLVYISLPTENGGLYSKAELTALHDVCTRCGLYLFIDGARLGYGLTSPENDVTLRDLCDLCDVFYIGGTKVGALFGEAVVITNPEIKPDFRYHIKQRGGMLAKGRLLGIQFDVLFTDNLYFEISKKAVAQAKRIAAVCMEAGCTFFADSPTNQQFPVFPDAALEKLKEKYVYSYWARVDETHSAIRLCTSWATKDENVEALCSDIRAIMADSAK